MRPDSSSWHRRLFLLSYEALGGRPDDRIDRAAYWLVVFGTALYVALGIVIFVSLNAATLIFGVFVEPIWRGKPRWIFLRLPNGLPVIPFSVAILLVYTSYRTLESKGPLIAFGGWLWQAGLVLGLVLLFAVFNWIRARLH